MEEPEPVAGNAGGIGRRREHAAGAVAGAAAGVLLGFLLGDRGVWIVAISVGALVAALVALAVSADRHRRPATAVAVALGLLVAGSLAALLALAGRVGESPWPAGVPLALWVLFGVLWLLPLLLTGLGYALTFELPAGDERDEPVEREEAP
ncbi:MAG TPA: hypothetical protein VM617_04590 [Thermoanaerobaculia bacterium]|nr:hypothetical protein [Thermoanaerobaculia bacterium]